MTTAMGRRASGIGRFLVLGFANLALLGLPAASRAQTCLDPDRVTMVGSGPGSEGCHEFDDQQESCETAYINGGGGVASCYFETDTGNCNGCGPDNEGLACTNTCVPPKVCAGDLSRTLFVGGPRTDACHQLDDDLASCELAFHRGGNGQLASCFAERSCRPCGDDGTGFCVNTCVPPPPCPDTSRTVFAGGPDTGACHQFDGNQGGCEEAYHLGNNGVASCYYDSEADECRGCGLNNQLSGNCTNTCLSCAGDTTRTNFAGGPGTGQSGGACRQYDEDPDTCNISFHLGFGGIASCFYDGEVNQCLGCGPPNESEGACTNTCAVIPTCLDDTRTVFVGGPESSGCHRFDDDENGCATAYNEGESGVTSCFFDADSGSCRGCGPENAGQELCTNTCVPPPTCDDDTRSIFTGFPGGEGCHQFDGNQASCVLAFNSGGSGVVSCFYRNGRCSGCGPDNVNDGLCVNTCGPPPVCGSDPERTELGCARFNDDLAACSTAFGVGSDGGPVSCAVSELCSGCGPNNQRNGLCVNTCAVETPAPAMSPWGLVALALILFAVGLYFAPSKADRSR